jgi:excisionase family DNA binding protein
MTENTEPRWTIDHVAQYLEISKNTLYGWRARRYGPPGRMCGKHLRFDPQEVREWYSNQPEVAA